MRELTCIVCPIGCKLLVEEEQEAGGLLALTIKGNRCKRGSVYAEEEIRSPKRVVTATIAVSRSSLSSLKAASRSLTAPRRIPVKTTGPCPKERTFELLKDIYALSKALPVKAGDKLIENWKDCGIDLVVTRSMA